VRDPSITSVQSNQVKASFCIILPLVIKNVLKYALPCNDMKPANLLYLFPEKCGLGELQWHSYKEAA
jgi:hypothetical protein